MDKEENEKLLRLIDYIALCNGDYRKVDRDTAKKRLEWWEKNKDRIVLEGSEVRKAFDLVFSNYMNVDPNDILVIYEREKKIIWRSYNPCPYLEACKQLSIDTRIFCKEGHHECMNDIIRVVNPNLVFSRSYERIRPYYPYCEESIELANPTKYY